MAKKLPPRTINFRCPAYLHKKLVEAADGQSPPTTLSREIVERLAASFNQPSEKEWMQNVTDVRDQWAAKLDAQDAEIAALKAKVEGRKK